MTINPLVFLKSKTEDLFNENTSNTGKEKNRFFKDILKELNHLKSVIVDLPEDETLPKNTIKQIINFKLSFKNIEKLNKLLNDLLSNMPQNIIISKKINPIVKNIQNQLKNIPVAKIIFYTAKEVINDLEFITNRYKNDIKLKNFIEKLENFSKTALKESDTALLKHSFIRIKKDFSKIKDTFLNKFPKKEINLLQKKIDTISSLLKIQENRQKEIKHFDTVLKDILLSHKTGKIKLIGQKTVIKNIGNIAKNLNEISILLANDKKNIHFKKGIEQFIKDINHINLEYNIKNSGIFFESKLFDIVQKGKLPDKVQNEDIKAILLKIKNEDTLKNNQPLQTIVDKTLTQINAVQTNAYISQTFLTYIPFSWESLKEGSLSIAKLKKEDGFSCKIELELDEKGKIEIMMLFYKDTLSLKMDIKNSNLKQILKKHNLELKKALKKTGYDTNIFFSDISKNVYNVQELYKNQMDVDITA